MALFKRLTPTPEASPTGFTGQFKCREPKIQGFLFTRAVLSTTGPANSNFLSFIICTLPEKYQLRDATKVLEKPGSEKYTSATLLLNNGIVPLIDDKHAIAHNKV